MPLIRYICINVNAAPDEPDESVPLSLRMNSFHAVTASHQDCADLLPKSKTTRLLGMKEDMMTTQEIYLLNL